MKRQYVIYGLFAFIFMIVLYFVTVAQVLVEKQNIFNDNVYIEARGQKNFDKFIGVQIGKYKLIDEILYEQYQLSLYQIIDNENIQKIVIIIIPLIKVEYAKVSDDGNDLSLVVAKSTNDNKTYLNTNSFDASISFGYDDSKIGFMLFDFTIKNEDEIKIEYFDYNEKLVFQYTNNFSAKTKEEIDLNFKDGYTLDEIKLEMNYESDLRSKLMVRITIYISIIIFVPFIYKLLKHILSNKKRGVYENEKKY